MADDDKQYFDPFRAAAYQNATRKRSLLRDCLDEVAKAEEEFLARIKRLNMFGDEEALVQAEVKKLANDIRSRIRNLE